MTQAWAIKGPDGNILAETVELSDENAWCLILIGSEYKTRQELKKAGYTCVPVTIVEGSAEPVGYTNAFEIAESKDKSFGMFGGKSDDFDIALYTAPPADDARALLDEAIRSLELALKYWQDRQQRYKNRNPVWVQEANKVLARGAK